MTEMVDMTAQRAEGRSRSDLGWLDAAHSPEIEANLPGLASALRADYMRARLQTWLLGSRADHDLEGCEPGKAYLELDGCTVRYRLALRDKRTGRSRQAIVTGRLFATGRSCAAFLQDQLVPLAAVAQEEAEAGSFETRVGTLPELNMAVHVFPVDPDLPTLIHATDRRRMKEALHLTSGAEAVDVDECRIEVAHYPRRGRCVLRFELETRGKDAGELRHRALYGKVFMPTETPSDHSAVIALRKRLREGGPARFAIPRAAGFVPELRMVLLEEVPGVPRVARLIAARLDQSTAGHEEPLGLEQAVDECAAIVATVHASGIDLGRRRALGDECDAVARELSMLKRVSPRLGALLDEAVRRVAAEGAPGEAMERCFCHGDYTPAQVLFDGSASALIDFDNTCQAEPALDLGHFAAYLRLAARKAEMRRGISASGLGDALSRRFLNHYLAAGPPIVDGDSLRRRLALYEQLSLVRVAIHSWHQLKPERVATALSVLEERASKRRLSACRFG
jgi:aminoglycoside phosphotransferase (APT) family kinase protein